ncbi:MAG: DUF1858 domain-containing protein [bacterium]|uniref:DUF1858 domain-containing protein n=2 Tax=Bacteria candidate phyla TaxID=1783234 RepID=A0A101I2Q9_UNCT6|nr:MAG: Uncharacterized protein XD76_1213 [candidate division TA06 bacterium 32_111]KUK87548.1 MAG: Uncharacterized protein XE03_0715 [candidate division TA06 bacterium 34_109]MDI6700292.1 DUF1858 domain-containing protein [bacterium]HAF08116.1 DUF1858 domain-containing protein [candidate division WOR-3 bacterium]HCP16678.1 DUF1858 domain-containing protein [candidate division WOR-3 bacterium]
MNKKVTLDMEVEDLVREFPQLISYLMDRDIICIRCGAPVWGSLRELLESKGMENPEKFVEEMNQFLEKNS